MIFPKKFKNFPKFQKFISFSVFEWAGPTRILIESSKSNLFKNHIFSRFWNFWTKCSELEVVNFCKKAENVQLLTSINLSKSSKIDCKCYFWTDYEESFRKICGLNSLTLKLRKIQGFEILKISQILYQNCSLKLETQKCNFRNLATTEFKIIFHNIFKYDSLNLKKKREKSYRSII